MAPGPHPDLRLPPELERNIFEIVALSARPSSIPFLSLFNLLVVLQGRSSVSHRCLLQN
jgi:hypothetical protein